MQELAEVMAQVLGLATVYKLGPVKALESETKALRLGLVTE